jgi:starch synthase
VPPDPPRTHTLTSRRKNEAWDDPESRERDDALRTTPAAAVRTPGRRASLTTVRRAEPPTRLREEVRAALASPLVVTPPSVPVVRRPVDAGAVDEAVLTTRDGTPAGIVHLAGELAPFARTGGLGEAVQSLARAQAMAGMPVSIVMPLYAQARAERELEAVGDAFPVQVGPRVEEARLYRLVEGRAPERRPRIFFIEHPEYFDRPGLYGEDGADYPDNHRRYAFFAKAALVALPRISQSPVVLHAHDWHTALGPVYLRTHFGRDPYYRRICSIVSVHNAGFQGTFGPEVMDDLGLPPELFNHRQMEWYGRANLLKGGVVFADAVTTVSPTHAHELRTKAGGFGLDGVFVALRDRFTGIANGIDQNTWDSATDLNITANYSRDDLSGKKKCRSALQRTFGLQQRPRVPIFAMTARLTSQKGLDLILGDPSYFALDAQFIFLGNGEPRYAAALAALAERAPSRIAVELNFNERLEHRLLAGADLCLMPSLYEPCGLTQMRAQRYGTIPVARRVGGLADTIEDGTTGFLFDDYTTADFMHALMRAVDQYADPVAWQRMMREAMSREFSWARSELKYRQLYRRVLGTAPVR